VSKEPPVPTASAPPSPPVTSTEMGTPIWQSLLPLTIRWRRRAVRYTCFTDQTRA